MVVLVTNLFRAGAAGILGPGSTSVMFIKLLRTRGKEEEDENINDYINGLVCF